MLLIVTVSGVLMNSIVTGCIVLSACAGLSGCFLSNDIRSSEVQTNDDYSIFTEYGPHDSRSAMTKKVRSSHSFPSYRDTGGKKVFVFDPNQTAWAAYDSSGNLIKTGNASGGKDYCADVGRRCKTPAGSFSVGRKGSASCVSSKFPIGKGGAPMPHCMFFKGGYAIHGSYNVPNHNASHGCIRVKPSAAAWLSSSFINIGTKVIVKSY
jgi:lipoprotein-anchoring transpeptidase ErfK/SrfK